MTQRIRMADTTEIEVKGRKVLIDEAFLPEFEKHAWYVDTNGYVATSKWICGTNVKCYLHRMINTTPRGYVTDHINGNKLDNRGANLRIATFSENFYNRGKPRTIRRQSKYKGVSLVTSSKRNKKWRMRIRHEGKTVTKYFLTEIEAAHCYDLYAIRVAGEFALTNRKLGLITD